MFTNARIKLQLNIARRLCIFAQRNHMPIKSHSRTRLRLLSHLVIAYLCLAFAWWSILLYSKNKEVFAAKKDLLRVEMLTDGRISNPAAFENSNEYKMLNEKAERQKWMIFGEAAFFCFSLGVGVWFINHGYVREVEASRQRRNFLLSITHELKSPLASIRLILDTILKRKLPEEKLNHLSKSAISETERLNKLVNDLLLSAKLDTAFRPFFEKININETIHNLVKHLSEKYDKASFHFVPEEKEAWIDADNMGLKTVILNLLENAVKYSGTDATIHVSTQQKNGKLNLQVADSGIGIPDKEKARIFQKFYRVGNEDTRSSKGTGLGLFIASQLVRAHDGSITVLDNQPKGSIFKITLPVAQS